MSWEWIKKIFHSFLAHHLDFVNEDLCIIFMHNVKHIWIIYNYCYFSLRIILSILISLCAYFWIKYSRSKPCVRFLQMFQITFQYICNNYSSHSNPLPENTYIHYLIWLLCNFEYILGNFLGHNFEFFEIMFLIFFNFSFTRSPILF